MKILFYSTKDFEQPLLEAKNKFGFKITFTAKALSAETVDQSIGFDCVSIFTADDASETVVRALHKNQVKFIAIRAAGFDNVHLETTRSLGIRVANVPEYSPYAIAEHAVALMLALNRKIVLANAQVHRNDFSLGRLIGFDMYQKTIGIIGTGRTGRVVARILHGFGANLLAYDIEKIKDLEDGFGLRYTSTEEIFETSDIISLHVPYNQATRYLINEAAVQKMKKGVMIINTARGAVVDTQAVLEGLRSERIGSFGMDVYEKEKGVFFYDRSANPPEDKLLLELMQMPNVLITPHQAFATNEALANIVDGTFDSIRTWDHGKAAEHEL